MCRVLRGPISRRRRRVRALAHCSGWWTLTTSLLWDSRFWPVERLCPRTGKARSRVVVISKRLAEVFWPGENPIGRPIQLSRQPAGIVVGIVANVRSQALAVQAQPEMYVPHAQAGNRTVTYAIHSALDSSQVIPAARRVVNQLDARLPLIGPGSMAELVDAQLARPRFYLVLMDSSRCWPSCSQRLASTASSRTL